MFPHCHNCNALEVLKEGEAESAPPPPPPFQAQAIVDLESNVEVTDNSNDRRYDGVE